MDISDMVDTARILKSQVQDLLKHPRMLMNIPDMIDTVRFLKSQIQSVLKHPMIS